MVKITSTTPSLATSVPQVNRTSAVEPVTTVEPEKQWEALEKPFVERRKKDRRTKNSSRGPYDMRGRRDRRRNGRKGRSIDDQV